MPTILGSGEHRYRVVENWAKLPEGWNLPDVASVAVDSKDQVYVFNRGDHPMVVFDREGNFIKSWGEGLFGRPHGLHIDADDNLYCTDDGDHTVRKCSPEPSIAGMLVPRFVVMQSPSQTSAREAAAKALPRSP